MNSIKHTCKPPKERKDRLMKTIKSLNHTMSCLAFIGDLIHKHPELVEYMIERLGDDYWHALDYFEEHATQVSHDFEVQHGLTFGWKNSKVNIEFMPTRGSVQ